MSHLLRGRYDEACRAAYRSVQANPAHSITHVQLAAALAKLGPSGGSEGGRRAGPRAASDVPLRSPVRRRRPRTGAREMPWGRAAGPPVCRNSRQKGLVRRGEMTR
ncbi:UNVERIFIED_ORG: hypothetical protein GGD51_003106 [Rhizobium esperanzae]